MTLDICLHIFEKYSNTKFHENPSSGSWVVPYGRKGRGTQVDRHDEGDSRLSQFFERTRKCKYEGRTESHEQHFFCMRTGNSRRRRVRW